MSESLDQKLTALKLGRMRQIYESWIEQAAHSNLSSAECLEQLLTEELLARQENVALAQDETGRLSLCRHALHSLISPPGPNSNARSSCATSTVAS